jgi:hypothetical protein
MKPTPEEFKARIIKMVPGSKPYEMAHIYYNNYDQVISKVEARGFLYGWVNQALRSKYGFNIVRIKEGVFIFKGFDDSLIKKGKPKVEKVSMEKPRYTDLQKLALGIK